MTRTNGHRSPHPMSLAPRDQPPDLGRAMILLSAERLQKRDEQVEAEIWREAIGWLAAAALIGLLAGLALGLMLGAQAALWARGG